MPKRPPNAKRPAAPSGEDRALEAIRVGFGGQARTSAKVLAAINRTNESVEEFSRNVDRMMLQISESIDRLTRGMTAAFDRLHEAMVEQARRMDEQGVRMEAMNRRIDETTAAIRENTAAILRIAEAIRRSRGDGQPGSGP